jgi:hypothetical protein
VSGHGRNAYYDPATARWNDPEKPTDRGVEGHSSCSSPGSSPVRPQVGSSVRPTPYRGTKGDDLVSGFVPERHSWAPRSLIAEGVRASGPPELGGLFYLGKNHLVSGESEAGKSWLLLAVAADELRQGRGVLWVDGDDVGPGDLLERLCALGASEQAIEQCFAYVRPDEPLDDEKRGELVAQAEQRLCRLVALDGFNPLLTFQGLDANVGGDVERFYQLVDPFRKLRPGGAATVLTDNVVKSRETRGTWAIGSERKKSKAEVHLGMKSLAPFLRDHTGKARLDVFKDRPGHLARPSPGTFVLVSEHGRCSWRLDPDQSVGPDGGFRPTALMERISHYLEGLPEPPSRNQIEKEVSGKAEGLRTAIDRLIYERFATQFDGPNRSKLVRLERAFRHDEGNSVEA